MNLKIEINNLPKGFFGLSLLKRVIRKTLEKVGTIFLAEKNVEISLANVSEKEMRKLNRIYRHKNTVTDVLSFAEYKNEKEIRRENGKEIFLGEIVFCLSDIEKYCRKNKIPFEKELAKVVSHGVLHLLGMRHGKKMFSIQDQVSEF